MATAVIKDHASQKRRNFISKFLIYFFLIVITACMLLPFLWMLSSSFKLNKDVFGFPIQWIPKNPRWQNYVDIWTQIPLLTFVKNTVKITVVVTLLQLFTSSFAAYAFAKMQFKGKNVLFLGYIATIAVPWQAYMVPQFMMMSSWHLNNTHLAIMCLQAFSAFGVFLMKQFYEGVPTELCEAARIDGLSEYGIWWHIMLPLSLPALSTLTIFTFVNKLDHEARDPFELMEEIENVLGINTYPMNWPIGSGRNFRGVFDRQTRRVIAFEGDGHANATKKVAEVEAELGDPAMDELIGEENHKNLMDDIELLDGAGDELDLDAVACGKLSPAFFGSALTNFGVEPFLKEFLRLAPTPRAYTDTLTSEPVDPCRDDFSGFVFKIQANMDKNHRDRIAFVRICSGKFERGMDAFHVQGNRKLKLATGTSMMADDRAIVDEAYAGDIVGLFDPGIFSIGDTVCSGKRHVQYPQIPTFAPEMFARITQVDTLKRKQFVKGMEELAQEGAIQIFRELGAGMESVIVGVVGVLQFEVLERRLKAEYRVEVRRQPLPYTDIRWIQNDPDTIDIPGLSLTRDTLRVEDMRGGKLLLFTSPWNVDWATDHNPDLILSEFGNVTF